MFITNTITKILHNVNFCRIVSEFGLYLRYSFPLLCLHFEFFQFLSNTVSHWSVRFKFFSFKSSSFCTLLALLSNKHVPVSWIQININWIFATCFDYYIYLFRESAKSKSHILGSISISHFLLHLCLPSWFFH